MTTPTRENAEQLVAQQMAIQEILQERAYQLAKWGDQQHEDAWWVVIETEELGEAAKEVFDGKPDELKAEVIQVAAVALAWLEDILRRDSDGQ